VIDRCWGPTTRFGGSARVLDIDEQFQGPELLIRQYEFTEASTTSRRWFPRTSHGCSDDLQWVDGWRPSPSLLGLLRRRLAILTKTAGPVNGEWVRARYLWPLEREIQGNWGYAQPLPLNFSPYITFPLFFPLFFSSPTAVPPKYSPYTPLQL
jgi:hypothetical protein